MPIVEITTDSDETLQEALDKWEVIAFNDFDLCELLHANGHKVYEISYQTVLNLHNFDFENATVKIAGALQKSTEVMKSMQSLVKVPEVAATMRDLSKEMTRAGIIEEMMEDTLEMMDDQEDLEEAAQEEVDKILFEVTAGQLGRAPAAVSDSLPAEEVGASYASDDEKDDVSEMQARLQALRS